MWMCRVLAGTVKKLTQADHNLLLAAPAGYDSFGFEGLPVAVSTARNSSSARIMIKFDRYTSSPTTSLKLLAISALVSGFEVVSC